MSDIRKRGGWALLVLTLGVLGWALATRPEQYLWDLAPYLRGAGAVAHGRTPYGPVDAAAAGKDALPFVYPPHGAHLFRPLLALGSAAYGLWAAVTLMAAGVVVVAGQRLHQGPFVFFVVFALVAFNGALPTAVASGNVAALEAACLTVAAVAYGAPATRRRSGTYAAAVVAASLFKLVPAFLLAVPWIQRRGPEGGGVGSTGDDRTATAVGTLVLVLVVGLPFLVSPEAGKAFLEASAAVSTPGLETGTLNPSARELAFSLARPLGLGGDVLYLPWVGLVGALTVAALRRATRRGAIVLALLAWALVLPRMKDYAYAALVAPTFAVLLRAPLRGRVVLLALALLPFGYGPFMGAAAAWGLALGQSRRDV